MTRLTPEREAEIRRYCQAYFKGTSYTQECLEEIDLLRTEFLSIKERFDLCDRDRVLAEKERDQARADLKVVEFAVRGAIHALTEGDQYDKTIAVRDLNAALAQLKRNSQTGAEV